MELAWREKTELQGRNLAGVSFADFHVERLVGKGCNGAVLAGVARGVACALKIMYNYGHNTTMVADLFETEYRFLKRVPTHFNIVAVLAIIRTSLLTPNTVQYLPEHARRVAAPKNRFGKRRYASTTGMLLELLPKTLDTYLAEKGEGVSAKLATALGVQLASALLHLYRNGVVHADLKLNNIMVDPSYEPPRLVVVDFGCAIMKGERRADMDERMRVHSGNGVMFAMGNPAHISPEVLDAMARRHKLSRESTEVVHIPLAAQPAFALGVLLYEICLDEHPIHSYPMNGHSAELFESIDYNELRASKGGGDEYCSIVRGLLEFDPSQRMSLEDAHRRLMAMASEPKMKRECMNCEEEYAPTGGVDCPSPDDRHFICSDCFQTIVQAQSEASLPDLRRRGGRIFCPYCPPKNRSSPFAEQLIARICGEDVHAAYFDARQRLLENAITAEADSLVRSRVEMELRRRAAMTERQRMVDDARKHVEQELLSDKCRNCGAVWFDFRNCAAVKCGNCSNYFCACCCEDFGPGAAAGIAAHDHVPDCAFNPRPGKLFVPPDEIRAARPKLRQSKVDSFLAGLHDDIRQDVVESCRDVLVAAGVKVPAEVAVAAAGGAGGAGGASGASGASGAGKPVPVDDDAFKKARIPPHKDEADNERNDDGGDDHHHEARPPSLGMLDALALVNAQIAAEEDTQRQDAIAAVATVNAVQTKPQYGVSTSVTTANTSQSNRSPGTAQSGPKPKTTAVQAVVRGSSTVKSGGVVAKVRHVRVFGNHAAHLLMSKTKQERQRQMIMLRVCASVACRVML